jgi:hypothetical protein
MLQASDCQTGGVSPERRCLTCPLALPRHADAYQCQTAHMTGYASCMFFCLLRELYFVHLNLFVG